MPQPVFLGYSPPYQMYGLGTLWVRATAMMISRYEEMPWGLTAVFRCGHGTLMKERDMGVLVNPTKAALCQVCSERKEP